MSPADIRHVVVLVLENQSFDRMLGYVTLPSDWTAEEAQPWVAEALAAAGELPPKLPKPRARKQA